MTKQIAAELVSDRLILKVLNKDAKQQVLDYFSRNKEFLAEWEPIREKEFYTKFYQQAQLADEYRKIKDGLMYKLWIFKKDAAEKVIGSIAFNNIVRGSFQSCHLGYRLDKDELNQGYMTEALKTAIEAAFSDLALHRIEANIMPKNKRSLRVVEKLGFYNEGLARKYLKINGKWEDHLHMVLLNEAME